MRVELLPETFARSTNYNTDYTRTPTRSHVTHRALTSRSRRSQHMHTESIAIPRGQTYPHDTSNTAIRPALNSSKHSYRATRSIFTAGPIETVSRIQLVHKFMSHPFERISSNRPCAIFRGRFFISPLPHHFLVDLLLISEAVFLPPSLVTIAKQRCVKNARSFLSRGLFVLKKRHNTYIPNN